jgi:hypothetical protein
MKIGGYYGRLRNYCTNLAFGQSVLYEDWRKPTADYFTFLGFGA